MTTAIALNLKTFLEDLKSSDLVGVSLRPQNLGLRLDFTFGPEMGDVAIEFDRILHLVISRPSISTMKITVFGWEKSNSESLKKLLKLFCLPFPILSIFLLI